MTSKQTFRIEAELANAGYQEAAKLELALVELVKAHAGLTVTRFSPAGKPRKPAGKKPA